MLKIIKVHNYVERYLTMQEMFYSKTIAYHYFNYYSFLGNKLKRSILNNETPLTPPKQPIKNNLSQTFYQKRSISNVPSKTIYLKGSIKNDLSQKFHQKRSISKVPSKTIFLKQSLLVTSFHIFELCFQVLELAMHPEFRVRVGRLLALPGIKIKN